jgi:hypothetical protein
MTREDFIDALNRDGYKAHVEGDKLIVDGDFWQDHITMEIDSIPSNVTFVNKGFISLPRLKEIPEGVTFNNSAYVSLVMVDKISSDTIFNNRGFVAVPILVTIPAGVQFNNRGTIETNKVSIDMLNRADWGRTDWGLDIPGISNRELFKSMVKGGVFA